PVSGQPLAVEVVTVVGSAEPGALVELFRNGTSVRSSIALSNGSFSFSLVALEDTQTTFVARCTDAAGNVSPFSSALVVQRNDAALAGLGVTVKLLPELPLVGEPVSALVTVRNRGASTSVAPAVSASLLSPDGTLWRSPSQALSSALASGG